jgi:hypothetical protein
MQCIIVLAETARSCTALFILMSHDDPSRLNSFTLSCCQ